MKSLLLSAAGAALLGLSTSVAIAQDSMNYTGATSGHDVVGSVMIHDVWSDVDVGTFDDDTNTIGGEFSIAHGLGNMWMGQVDASFNSVQYDSGAFDGATDVLRFGVGAFYSGDNSRLGVNIGYDSIDFGTRNDGLDIGVGGEFYLSNQLTLAGGVSYVNLDGSAIDGDGWGLDGKGTYYLRTSFSLALHLNYLDFDFDGAGGDAEAFGVGGELEYLCPDSPLSFQAALRYSDLDFSTGGDGDATSIELGLKWRFNTQGDLVEQDRSNTFNTNAAAANLRTLAF